MIATKPLTLRSHEEIHRISTPLELLFDLVIVIAVAATASGLRHAISENHVADGVFKYAIAFFGVWWAWVGFTWFASAYDNDDWAYRLAVFVMMLGALILASGEELFFKHNQMMLPVIGYVIMRLSLVGLWWRVARANPNRRKKAIRYSVGIAVLQLGWIIGIPFFHGQYSQVFLAVMIAGELLLPWFAERAQPTNWHSGHIAERHGLLTIIVLGESVLAASLAIQQVAKEGQLDWQVFWLAACGITLVFAMWWIYFSEDKYVAIRESERVFVWGYGHVIVFASGAAVGAALGVALDYSTGHSEASLLTVHGTLAISVSVFLASVWFVHDRLSAHGPGWLAMPMTALAVLLSALTPICLELATLLVVGCVAIKSFLKKKDDE